MIIVVNINIFIVVPPVLSKLKKKFINKTTVLLTT